MKVERRLFTLEEANALIPKLEARFSHLLQKKEQYLKRHDELFMHQLLADAEQHANLSTQTEDLEKEIHELETSILDMEKDIHEIRQWGCILRNVNTGYVDFLGQWNGEKIYFCWKKGEKDIQYYHSLQNDKSDRRPLFNSKQDSRRLF